MDILQIIHWIFATTFLISFFAGIAMVYYSDRKKVKEIDISVYGFEIPYDSMFYKMQSIPEYGGAFAWYRAAKSSNLIEIRDKFDKQFQKPFIITFWLMMTGFVSMVLGITLDHLFLHQY